MTCKIFVSYSSKNPETTAWVRGLVHSVCKHTTIRKEEVYWFGSADRGEVIQAEVDHKIAEATMMLCIVDDDYLARPWPVYEHFRYTSALQASKAKKRPIPIATPHLTLFSVDTASQSRDLLEAKWPSIEKPVKVARKDNHFFPLHTDLKKHFHSEWLEMLVDVRLTNLAAYVKTDELDPNLEIFKEFESLVTQIKRATDDGDPHAADLQRLAGISAFALATDRYYEGGWGFSFGDLLVDAPDAELATSGRREIDLVAIHALERFLSPTELHQELDAALSTRDSERPSLRPTDRMKEVLEFGTLLQLADKLDSHALARSADVAGQLKLRPLGARWVVEPETATTHETATRQHEALTCAFVDSCRAFAQQSSAFHAVLSKAGVTEDLITEMLGRLDRRCREWLVNNSLFSLVTNDHWLRAEAGDHRLADIFSLCATWIILSRTEAGKQIIIDLLRPRPRRIVLSDEFIAGIRRRLEPAALNETAAARLVTVLVSCLAVLRSVAEGEDGEASLREPFEALLKVALTFLKTPAGLRALLSGNSVGWSGVLLLQRKGLFARSMAENLWKAGLHLREVRVRSLTLLSPETGVGTVRQAVEERIDAMIAEDAWAPVFESQPREMQNRVATLIKQLPVCFPESRETQPFPVTGRPIVGTLRVRYKRGEGVDSGQIQQESAGYRALFLEPFSAITQVRLATLRDLRRELGKGDRTLIEKMGTVVVLDFVAFDPATRAWSRDADFGAWTNKLLERLLDESWREEHGSSDFIRLHGPRGKSRWVQRSALIEPRAPGADPQFVDLTWWFLEIPDSFVEAAQQGKERAPDELLDRRSLGMLA